MRVHFPRRQRHQRRRDVVQPVQRGERAGHAAEMSGRGGRRAAFDVPAVPQEDADVVQVLGEFGGERDGGGQGAEVGEVGRGDEDAGWRGVGGGEGVGVRDGEEVVEVVREAARWSGWGGGGVREGEERDEEERFRRAVHRRAREDATRADELEGLRLDAVVGVRETRGDDDVRDAALVQGGCWWGETVEARAAGVVGWEGG